MLTYTEILDRLRNNDSGITKIHFGNANVGSQRYQILSRALMQHLPSRPLHVTGLIKTSTDVKELVEALQYNTSLTSLTIEGCQNKGEGFSLSETDIQLLLSCKNITHLDLSWNRLSRVSVQMLAKSKHLKSLVLNGCHIAIPDLFLFLNNRCLTKIDGVANFQEDPKITAMHCQDADIQQLVQAAEFAIPQDTIRLALAGDNNAKLDILSYFNREHDSGYVLANIQNWLESGSSSDIKAYILDTAFNVWNKKINTILGANMLRGMEPNERIHIKQLKQQEDLEKAVIDAIDDDDDQALENLIPQLQGGVNTRLRYGDQVRDGVPDDLVYTPLTIAAEDGRVKCVRKLLQMGANIELAYKDLTPQFLAAEQGHDEVVSILLAHASNIKGEFPHEDALSIAAFKYNNLLIQLINSIERINPKSDLIQHFLDEAHTLIDIWDHLFTSPGLPPWQAFNEDHFKFDLTAETIPYFYLVKELSKFIDIDEGIIDSLEQYKLAWEEQVRLYCSMFKAVETDELEQQDPYLTDGEESEAEEELVRKIAKPIRKVQSEQTPRLFIANKVDELNREIREYGIENIDWSKYPKLYIAQYRGIHFYRNFFTPEQRRQYRRTSHLNRHTPSSASIELSGGTPATHQYTRESDIELAIARLRNWNVSLESIKNCEVYWNTSMMRTVFETARDLVQHRYSNSMSGFLADLERDPGNNAVLKAMQSVGFKRVPYLSTSDKPEHALKYGYGQKSTDFLRAWRLRPRFSQQGKPKRPYPGKLNIFLFSAREYHSHDFNHVFSMNAGFRTSVGARIVSEREASTAGGIYQPCNFYEETLEIPSLVGDWNKAIEDRYGLTRDKYNQYKRVLANSELGSDERRKVKNKIIDTVIEHKEQQLLDAAHKEANRRGGYLVYRGLGDGKVIQFRLVEPQNKEVTARQKKRAMPRKSSKRPSKQPRTDPAQSSVTDFFKSKSATDGQAKIEGEQKEYGNRY